MRAATMAVVAGRTTAVLGAVVIAAALAPAAHGDFTFRCPAPDEVRQHTIPKSLNCAYSAESDGVEFGGFNNCGLARLPFVGAIVSELNGYWSLNCSYAGGAQGNTLSVGPDPVIDTCRFADGSQTCTGTRDECAITCASKPGAGSPAEDGAGGGQAPQDTQPNG